MLGFVQFHCASDVTQNHHITKDVLTKALYRQNL